ncbi:Plasmodium exported protein, unknown function [Plasmodium gonderi]|uniref:Pv-fam-d protein n=1 Tax=Plasmodium gonderi TaxID=77519 RepID=A0A1Y1JGI7_PLAGO|nr:Plasmodium exported protein, unknown function [Plasmodium gonderi]GAW79194.1 Plasmodium exported protein, unknown function [Plasmodium gonderi]
MKRRTYKNFTRNIIFIITLLILALWNCSNKATSSGISYNEQTILNNKCNLICRRILLGDNKPNSEIRYAVFKEKIINLLREDDDNFEKGIKAYMQDDIFRKRFNIFLENEEFNKNFNVLVSDFDLMKFPNPVIKNSDYMKSPSSIKFFNPFKKGSHRTQNENHSYSYGYKEVEKGKEVCRERKLEKNIYEDQIQNRSKNYSFKEKKTVIPSEGVKQKLLQKENVTPQKKLKLSDFFLIFKNADEMYETQLINMIRMNKKKKGKLFWIKYNKNIVKAIIPIIGGAIGSVLILSISLNLYNIIVVFTTMVLSMLFVLYKYKKCADLVKNSEEYNNNSSSVNHLPK